MNDRFNSREEIEFDREAYSLGAQARRQGQSIQKPPEKFDGHKIKSWRAGWADQDMSLLFSGERSDERG